MQRMGYLVGILCLILGLAGGIGLSSLLSAKHVNPTSTAEAKPSVIVAAGDIACEPERPKTTTSCRSDDTASLIASLNPDAVLALGDNQYPNGSLQLYETSFDKSWGAFKSKLYPVPGNHEYLTPDAAGYYDYFGDRAGERGKGYYSFSLGTWRIIALNSEIDVSNNSLQLTWLAQELKDHPAACTLAFWHQPRFSTGGHKDNSAYDALWRLLYANNVDIVLNGHSHGYERFAPQNPDAQFDSTHGIVEFVSGMGGRDIQGTQAPTPNLATRQNHAFGVLQLSLFPQAAHYDFVSVPGQQTFADAGIVPCH